MHHFTKLHMHKHSDVLYSLAECKDFWPSLGELIHIACLLRHEETISKKVKYETFLFLLRVSFFVHQNKRPACRSVGQSVPLKVIDVFVFPFHLFNIQHI
ncbi:unnamed protein product [Orchesella dallaii]|uniref:Uncharacterized protein n=1 Tax=Orchesella dallaii TaxID=48710 RepID=A0ABP1RX61_9HEXA